MHHDTFAPWRPKVLIRPKPAPKPVRQRPAPTPEKIEAMRLASYARARKRYADRMEAERARRASLSPEEIRDALYAEGKRLRSRLHKMADPPGASPRWQAAVVNIVIARCLDANETIEGLYGHHPNSRLTGRKDCFRDILVTVRRNLRLDANVLGHIFRLSPELIEKHLRVIDSKRG